MHKRWDDVAWQEYVDWQFKDAKIVQRINNLVKDIEQNGVSKGIGKPERLKHMKRWSRRIDDEHRLVYDIDENGSLYILSCKGHYE